MNDSPVHEEVVQAFRSDRLLKMGLITGIASTLFFATAGALVGWLLGLLAPEYYRISFDFGDDMDAAKFGLGQGLIWGAIAGVIIGCVVLLSTAWYKSRIRKAILEQVDKEE